jgi:hypothetical protein
MPALAADSSASARTPADAGIRSAPDGRPYAADSLGEVIATPPAER